MIIEAINNQTVEIRIMNYQFPNTRDREYDGNWLNIYLNVKSNLGNWQIIDPSLLTWEVQELIDWFDLLSQNKKPKWIQQVFIEPNLSFRLIRSHDDSEKYFKIEFQLESRPPSAKEKAEYFVEFHASNSKLADIAKKLQDELAKYPERK